MSESTYSLFQQGKAHLKRGMAAQATVALEKAKKREPDKASIREALGIAYFRIRRWEEAEAEFRKVLELSPVNDYAHYALGRCLEKQGRDPRGEPALQARELAPARVGAVPRADHRARLSTASQAVAGDAADLVERGDAGEREPEAVLAERRHALRDRLGEDLVGRAGLDQPAHPALHRHHLVQRDAAREPGAAALDAADGAVEPQVLARLVRPSSSSSSALGQYASRQASQSRRASRCATMQLIDVASRLGSTPMSTRRAIDDAALCVCSVVSTRWPVIAAWMAMRAVSSSRISPTRSTSGSERRIVRSPRANVRPLLKLTSIWLMPAASGTRPDPRSSSATRSASLRTSSAA